MLKQQLWCVRAVMLQSDRLAVPSLVAGGSGHTDLSVMVVCVACSCLYAEVSLQSIVLLL